MSTAKDKIFADGSLFLNICRYIKENFSQIRQIQDTLDYYVRKPLLSCRLIQKLLLNLCFQNKIQQHIAFVDAGKVNDG